MKKTREFLAALFAGAALMTSSVTGAQQQTPATAEAETPAQPQPVELGRYIEYKGYNHKVGSIELIDFEKRQVCESIYDIKDLMSALEAKNMEAIQKPELPAESCRSFSSIQDVAEMQRIVDIYRRVSGEGKNVTEIDGDDIRSKAMPVGNEPKAGRYII